MPLVLLGAVLAWGAPTAPSKSGQSHELAADLSEEDLARLGSEVLIQEEGDPSGQEGSGGRAVVHRAGGKGIRVPGLERKAPDARIYRTGAPSFEPTLGITKSGAIFFNGFTPGGDPQVLEIGRAHV